ncbi:PREDICTED: uncharacterized protein LOC104741307 isoform X2 [Camelina sativa]|uniref:Uncharacterized protein LOC104741307 isoform X2 n=1 Tax=Camelina sativa TaxID=90675 RepID=A0ABM0VSE2_CAMSA|nr:PREDICTED: uncharacterized protein LOC104741307 isoform X2 [Camelina sativa]XP_010460436.1 PREDICTED: uncharacterized protein LOC104741307 isoform X2 [Camelina sativa]XP_010460437.1 PREDICTED: uncharacterized protein LOC104741307 isoform X2 [Camelina sativa]XP_010460438.1 PREDICTED: uncharacterized protein LOC104741307 isoform X2 [Camelina sativa]
MGILSRSSRRSEESMKLLTTALFAIAFGILLGLSFPSLWITQTSLPRNLLRSIAISHRNSETATPPKAIDITTKIWEPSNPRGAERLPPGIIASESDFYLRRLWGNPDEDLKKQPRYLATFTVGYNQRHNIDAYVNKFSDNFTIVLFHYDGRTSEWNDEFEWSKNAIHISVKKQTKWWYAKRFLHPDIVAQYDYIFIWDEDLGVDHFNAEEYVRIVKKHGLEISQPGLDPERGFNWQITKRREHSEVHKETDEKLDWCSHPPRPPCAGFVEIMAPVFSKNAWRCVWYMIQNDLVHGWGLDFALRRCVEEPAYEKIGIVDSQWIVHQFIPSLGNEGNSENGKAPWQGVRDRCQMEWKLFEKRVENAEKDYFKSLQVESPSNSTTSR